MLPHQFGLRAELQPLLGQVELLVRGDREPALLGVTLRRIYEAFVMVKHGFHFGVRCLLF